MPVTDIGQTDPYPITVWQGKNFSIELDYTLPDGVTPVNLTGWTARAQIKWAPEGELMTDMGVTVNATAGTVTLTLTPIQASAVVHGGVYDVMLINGSTKVGLLRGDVNVIKAVTV